MVWAKCLWPLQLEWKWGCLLSRTTSTFWNCIRNSYIEKNRFGSRTQRPLHISIHLPKISPTKVKMLKTTQIVSSTLYIIYNAEVFTPTMKAVMASASTLSNVCTINHITGWIETNGNQMTTTILYIYFAYIAKCTSRVLQTCTKIYKITLNMVCAILHVPRNKKNQMRAETTPNKKTKTKPLREPLATFLWWGGLFELHCAQLSCLQSSLQGFTVPVITPWCNFPPA